MQQLDVRLEQAHFMPMQLQVIRKRSRRRVAEFSAQYIRYEIFNISRPMIQILFVSFYNCLWLIFNDIIVGSAVGAFLCENCDELGKLLGRYAKVINLPRPPLM